MSDEYVNDTDETVAQGSKVSVTFDRKVSDGNYGGIECRAWVEGEVPAGSSADIIVAKLQELFAAAKVTVLDELAIPYVMDENGVVREKQVPNVGPVVSTETRVDHATGGGGHTLKIMNADEARDNGPIPAEVVEWAKSKGITAIYDNRHSRTERQPHFKQAITRAQKDAGVKGEAYYLKN